MKRLTQRQAGDRSQTPAAASFTGEFIVVDRSRLVDGGREIFSKRLFEGREQRFPQRDVVGELDPILDITDGKTTDRWHLPGGCRL